MTALYSNPLSADMPTAAQLATLAPLFARRTSDAAPQNNNTAFVNDTQLFVPLAAGAAYEMTAVIRYSTNATANLAVAWAAWSMSYEAHVIAPGGTAWVIVDQTESSALSVSGTTGLMRMTGLVFAGPTNLTLQFRWGQATANVSNTFVKDRSYIKLTQVT